MGTHPIFESDFDCLTDMDSSETVEVLDKAIEGLQSPVNDESGKQSDRQEEEEKSADEVTPLIGDYTPRGLLESCSLSSRSWRNTSSYIARISYYSRLNPNIGALSVPPHIAANYLVIPTATGYQTGGKQSSIVTIFAIWNTMMGTSMLSMSWGIQAALKNLKL